MSRTSNTFYAPVANVPAGTTLAEVAAGLSSNTFGQVPYSGWPSALFHIPDPADAGSLQGATDTNPAFTYCTKASYDQIHGKIHFCNTTHVGAGPYPWPGCLYWWTYDMASNTWQKLTPIDRVGNAWDAEVYQGHQDEFITVDPTNGNLHKRGYAGGASSQIYRLTYGQPIIGENWVQTGTFYESNITGTCDYWPALNGGAGGLVLAKQIGIQGTNATFTAVNKSLEIPNSIGSMQYVGCVTGNYYNWTSAGGSSNPANWFRMDSSFGSATLISNLPYGCGVGNGRQNFGVLCAHPNGNDIVALPPYLIGTVYIWRASNPGAGWQSAYTLSAGATPPNGLNGANGSTSYARCTLHDLGVIAILHCNGEGDDGSSRLTIYKPPA